MEKKHKTRLGQVVSDKMDKTVIVEVEWRKPHPKYKKVIRKGKKFKAHDQDNTCRVGDTVRIIETRPLSKEKRWRVTEIIARPEIAEVHPAELRAENDSNLHQT